ncbi:PucR family transcriptional regulator [Kocuria rhizophila]|uniref:PucR family transcriptional regulator n=1 Tax=Kocuria rhizophila TaxID=72000 RepID=UPI001DBCE675|nr:PucR family transcriptional regulator [Kocuria rhizophila]MCC5675331.1 PucR family transcriptional regulator [Kocuria rhizophila]
MARTSRTGVPVPPPDDDAARAPGAQLASSTAGLGSSGRSAVDDAATPADQAALRPGAPRHAPARDLHRAAPAPGAPSAPADPDPAALTVGGVAALEPFRRGNPQLLSERASAATGLPVRWVHVIETSDATGLLEGGEFVLSTVRILDAALAEGRGDEAAAAFLDGIEKAGAVALAVEVLSGREPVVRVLRAAAAHRELPVYLLSRQVRFVAVTQEAHRRIAARQLEQLETDRRIHEVFTQLTLEAAPVQRIVAEAGRLLGAEVVWWRRASSSSPGDSGGTVPVLVAGETVGWLSAEPRGAGPALRATVLERAAQAVALTLLSERSRRDEKRQAETALLHELRRPWNVDEDSARRRAHGLGIGVLRHGVLSEAAPAAWLPVVVRWERPGADPLGEHQGGGAVLDALAWALGRERTTALAGRLGAASVAVLVPLAARTSQDAVVERVLAVAEQRLGGAWRVLAGVSDFESGMIGAAARLDEAGMIAEAAVSLLARDGSADVGSSPGGAAVDRPAQDDAARSGTPRRRCFRARDVRLRGLLAMLRGDERVQMFARAELGSVLNVERREDRELLTQFLACGGNKSLLAQRIYLSRPALYGRLARLERRLGVSLDDPESRTSLHVALLIAEVEGC